MKRIFVDFNSLNSEPVGLVKLASPESAQWRNLPPLAQGERVVLSNGELEV